MNSLLEILSPSFLLRDALYSAVIVGLVCPLVGVYFLLRRLVFLGVTLPQVSAAGIAGAFMLYRLIAAGHKHGEIGEQALAYSGSIALTLAALAVFVWSERSSTTASDARIGAVYALAASLTILFLAADPQGEAEMVGILRGDLLATTSHSLLFSGSIFAVIAAVILVFQRQFLLISFDRDLCQVFRMRIALWDSLLFLLMAVTVAVGVMSAGPIVVFGFLVVPPLAARSLASTMTAFCLLSALIGAASAFLGFWMSYALDLPLGPTEVAFSCLILIAISPVRLLRRRPAAQQKSFTPVEAAV